MGVARLRIQTGPGAGRSFALSDEPLTIGRSVHNAIVVEGNGISRRHAEVRPEGGRFILADLGSTNGVILNGAPLAGPRELNVGDIISLPGVSILFEDETAAETAADPHFSRAVAGMVAARKTGTSELVLRRETAEVVVRGRVVQLAPKEFRALALLHERAGAVVGKEELAAHVWPGSNGDVTDYAIHQLISRIRRTIEEDPANPRLLLTRPGFGYRLNLA
jgi:DNA-binding winged helix-turn-helix (wHTH) protein